MSIHYEKRFLNQHSPTTSPVKNGRRVNGDRYVPVRSLEDWDIKRIQMSVASQPSPSSKTQTCDSVPYRTLLQNELLSDSTSLQYHNQATPSKLKFDTSPYAKSPITPESRKYLRSPRKVNRKIPKVPFKVLDAPDLQDDFYLNLVDWSSTNVLAVGLNTCVYLWNARTSHVTKLCDLSSTSDSVTSVCWSDTGKYLSVGTNKGLTTIWDPIKPDKAVSIFEGHLQRVGCLAWNDDILCSGSRDRSIIQRDIRTTPLVSERKLDHHRQEVCGLKFSTDGQYLASGGNDNKLLVWTLNSRKPVQTYTDHTAAVKAIAWSPHHHGLLASGGGTADRTIRFWNTLTGQAMQSVDTGSQVCNIAWSKHSSELVSTHGYSQNHVIVWKYPSLESIAKLAGHTYRVLYLAMSPDGDVIVTGAGDETLRFWSVFSKQIQPKERKSALNLFSTIR